MCGRVHSSARRWHVAWMADAFLCRARTLCSRQTLDGFEQWLLLSGSLASQGSFSQLPYQTRDPANCGSSQWRVV